MSAADTTVARISWPATPMHMTTVQVGSGASGVIAAAYSGVALLGEIGGALAGIAAVVALILSVAAGNAKRRRQYDTDLRAQYQQGQKDQREADERARTQLVDELAETRRERDDYRDRYMDMLEGRERRRDH